MYKFTRSDSDRLFQSSKERIDRIKHKFIFKYLRVELQDAYKHLGKIKFELINMCRDIEKILPNNIAGSFFRRQEINYDIMWNKEIDRISKKIFYLRAKHIRQEVNSINYNIKQIVLPEMDGGTSFAPLKIENVLTKVTNSEKIHSTHNINIAPDGFNEIFNICNTNEKWLKNLSNIMIPEKAKIVLQLGQHFNLPNNMVNKNNITQEFIKHVEYSLFKADDETRNYVRNESIRIMKSIKKCDIKSFENIVLQEGVGEVK